MCMRVHACVQVACLLAVVCACCFVYVFILVQHVSGCLVCLSGCVKVCAVHAGLCALERDGEGGAEGNAEFIEGGVCLAGAACVLSSQRGSLELVAGTGCAFRLGAELVTRALIPMKY